MTARGLYRAGKLDEAIQKLGAELRDNPTDAARRMVLFELRCFTGEYDRAGKHLDVGDASVDAVTGSLGAARRWPPSEAETAFSKKAIIPGGPRILLQSAGPLRRLIGVLALRRSEMSWFAHYLKAIMRDKIGSFMSRDGCQKFLHKWIMQYTAGDDSARQARKAKYPLREAGVEVADVPGKPGTYRAVCFRRPHFQLDEFSVSLRLLANFPKSQ